MALWGLEFRKMFLKRSMLILAAVLLVVNGFKIISGSKYNLKVNLNFNDSSYDEFQKSIEGEMTDEKTKQIIEGHEKYLWSMQSGEPDSEYLNHYIAYKLYVWQYEYHFRMSEIIDSAKENVEFYNAVGNNLSAKENELIVKNYDNRFISSYCNSEDVEILFDYDFSTLMLLIVSLFFSMQLFYNEKQTGMDTLLLTNHKGRKILPVIKISTLLAAIVLVSFLFYAEDVIIHSIIYHINGWANPVYAVTSHEFCIFSGSIFEYYLLTCLIKVGAVFTASLLFSFVSMLIAGKIMPAMINLLLIFGGLLLSEGHANISLSVMVNPVVMMQPDGFLKEFNAIRFGNVSVTAITAAVLLIVFYIAFGIALNYIAYRRSFVSGWLRRAE